MLHGTAMVAKGASVQLDLAEGMADVEGRRRVHAGTRFQLCSVSKQFTAAAVLLLAKSGRLDRSEPIGRWLPGSPPQWQQVTLH